MALAFEPDFQSFLDDLHRGPIGAHPLRAVPQAAPPQAASPQAVASLYRRRRVGVLVALAIGILAMSSLLGGTGALGALVSTAGASGTAPIGTTDAIQAEAIPADATVTYVVQPGDTLWSIVGNLGLDGDRRVAVHAVAEANGGATLAPGQVLTLDAALQ